MDHHFYFSDWLTQSEGERVIMRRKGCANSGEYWKSATQFCETMWACWRIRMRFQEDKFLCEKWYAVYAVLFTRAVRKNGI